MPLISSLTRLYKHCVPITVTKCYLQAVLECIHTASAKFQIHRKHSVREFGADVFNQVQAKFWVASGAVNGCRHQFPSKPVTPFFECVLRGQYRCKNEDCRAEKVVKQQNDFEIADNLEDSLVKEAVDCVCEACSEKKATMKPAILVSVDIMSINLSDATKLGFKKKINFCCDDAVEQLVIQDTMRQSSCKIPHYPLQICHVWANDKIDNMANFISARNYCNNEINLPETALISVSKKDKVQPMQNTINDVANDNNKFYYDTDEGAFYSSESSGFFECSSILYDETKARDTGVKAEVVVSAAFEILANGPEAFGDTTMTSDAAVVDVVFESDSLADYGFDNCDEYGEANSDNAHAQLLIDKNVVNSCAAVEDVADEANLHFEIDNDSDLIRQKWLVVFNVRSFDELFVLPPFYINRSIFKDKKAHFIDCRSQLISCLEPYVDIFASESWSVDKFLFLRYVLSYRRKSINNTLQSCDSNFDKFAADLDAMDTKPYKALYKADIEANVHFKFDDVISEAEFCQYFASHVEPQHPDAVEVKSKVFDNVSIVEPANYFVSEDGFNADPEAPIAETKANVVFDGAVDVDVIDADSEDPCGAEMIASRVPNASDMDLEPMPSSELVQSEETVIVRNEFSGFFGYSDALDAEIAENVEDGFCDAVKELEHLCFGLADGAVQRQNLSKVPHYLFREDPLRHLYIYLKMIIDSCFYPSKLQGTAAQDIYSVWGASFVKTITDWRAEMFFTKFDDGFILVPASLIYNMTEMMTVRCGMENPQLPHLALQSFQNFVAAGMQAFL